MIQPVGTLQYDFDFAGLQIHREGECGTEDVEDSGQEEIHVSLLSPHPAMATNILW